MKKGLSSTHIRWGLIGALFVLGYAIMLAWQRDYHSLPTAAGPESAAATAPPVAALPLPAGDAASSGGGGELPQVETQNTSQPDNLIEISNDSLRLLVDLRGGDVVRADLLQFKEQLGLPQAYNLMRRDLNKVYVAQSGLVGGDGIDSANASRPLYTSARTSYAANGSDLRVDLEHNSEAMRVVKSFLLSPDGYQLEVRYRVENLSSRPLDFNFFAQIMHDGKRPEVEGGGLGVRPYIGAALTTEESNYLKYDFEDMVKRPLRASVAEGWIGLVQHYFMSAWTPTDRVSKYNYSSRVASNGLYIVGFTSPNVVVPTGSSSEIGAVFFAGPKTQDLLEPLAPHIELAIDYGWFWFISQPLFMALSWFHSLVGNWGGAIILLTLGVKLIFFPLTQMSFTSMARMRKFTPQITKIREQCGDDKQKLSQEMMKLYKRERINPMSGCLPILVQMPVFIALYWTLIESVELRHAPFMLWIHDLAVMDPYFVLPLLMGITMYIQQLLSPAPPDPTQAKIMRMLPVVFTFFFLWFPAGLTLYWVVNNTLSIMQQYLITRKLERSGLGHK